MAKVGVSEYLAKYGPSTIQIYGSIGGILSNSSMVQFFSIEDVFKFLEDIENLERMSEDEKFHLRKKIMQDLNHFISDDYRFIAVSLGFERDNGEPLRCWNCGEKSFASENSYDGPYIVETTVNCSNCNKKVGEWAYGNWM